MIYSKCFIILLFSIVSEVIIAVNGTDADYKPTQVHISIGNNENERVVSWSTEKGTEESWVEYRIKGGTTELKVQGDVLIDKSLTQRYLYIHSVVLKDLSENTTYEYRCGSKLGWSKFFQFRMPPFGENWSPNIIIYGDFGLEKPRSLNNLIKEAHSDKYDAIFHIGDIAYELQEDKGAVGDNFMNMIEPMAAYVPYMTAPGNHEHANNYSHYKSRFRMPGDAQGMFYSVNIGPVHFVIISTDAYLNTEEHQHLVTQTNWLKKDLKEASNENRDLRPWIIVLGHHPPYCTNCGKDNPQRVGYPPYDNDGLEKIFNDYSVDLTFWGHEHSYERTWPVYNFTVYNGTKAPYTNPTKPVYIVTGIAGCKYGADPPENSPAWSATRRLEFGYSRIKVYNATHLHFEQVGVNANEEVIDEFWLIKPSHGNRHDPYKNNDTFKKTRLYEYYEKYFSKIFN